MNFFWKISTPISRISSFQAWNPYIESNKWQFKTSLTLLNLECSQNMSRRICWMSWLIGSCRIIHSRRRLKGSLSLKGSSTLSSESIPMKTTRAMLCSYKQEWNVWKKKLSFLPMLSFPVDLKSTWTMLSPRCFSFKCSRLLRPMKCNKVPIKTDWLFLKDGGNEIICELASFNYININY